MTDIVALRRTLIDRLLGEDGSASPALRREAFENRMADPQIGAVAAKAAFDAGAMTDDDFAAMKRSGLSEDQIFEVVICSVVGEAWRRFVSAVNELDAAGPE